VFENVNEVQFHEKDYDKMLAVISKEGEKIHVWLHFIVV
jgi:dynein heavy chain